MIIYVASYPRSGNSLFMNLIKHHLHLPVYSVYKEQAHLGLTHLTEDDLAKLAEQPGVFFVKTHELPDSRTSAIYLLRDGRDAIISYAHYMIENKINLPDLPTETIFNWALNSLIMTPNQFSGWASHVLTWTQRSEKTVIIHFEELIQSQNQIWILKSALSELGLTNLEIQDVSPLQDFRAFHNKNPEFYRNGMVGNWLMELPVEFHLKFWERHGNAMKKMGYANSSHETSLRLEVGMAEVLKQLQEEKQRIDRIELELQAIRNSAELLSKEEVIQNFRKSITYSLIHGPFRHIPLVKTFAQISQWFRPQLGKLVQHSPRPASLPATYFKVEKLIEPAPKISIVTPTYNYARFLERTVKSIIHQRYPALEYIVQDGGSTDGTIELVKKFRHHLKHFESYGDNGQVHAINLGFQHASGDIMAYLNSDDILLPGTLNYVANYFSTNPEVDVIYGHRLIINEYDLVIGDWSMPPHDPETLRWADYVPQETVFWRRKIWEKTGTHMDETFQFAMDWDMLLRFQAAGARFQRLPRYLAAFRVHSEQKTSIQISGLGEQEINRLRVRNFGRQVDEEEVRQNIHAFLRRSVWHRWVHRLKIEKTRFLARWTGEEALAWYESDLSELDTSDAQRGQANHDAVAGHNKHQKSLTAREPAAMNDWSDQFIPLGLNCDIAHFLRKNLLRQFAFPFDWNITPIESAIQLLDNNFEDFLNPENMIYLPPVPRMLFTEDEINPEVTHETITPVVCHKYRMLFPHDFSARGRLELLSVQSKYMNRIERLRNLLNSDKKLVFVVHDAPLNDWQKQQYFAAFGANLENKTENWKNTLSGVLRKKHERLKFDLVDFDDLQKLTGTAQ